jgi:magnesium transporter
MFGQLLLPELRELIQLNDTAGMREFLDALHPATSVEVLENVTPAEIWSVLGAAALERQAEVFGYFDPTLQVRLVESVDRPHLSRLIESMAPDDRVSLLKEMDPEHVESLLPLMAQAERNDIRRLLSYPDGSAGSIMTTDYASLPEHITVAEALDQLRRQAPDRETIYYIYILDDDRKLNGFVTLRTLILARPNAKLDDIMERDVFAVRVDDDQEHVAQQMAKYDFLAMPVVDQQNRLVGIITHDDVIDVLQEEATEDVYRAGAVSPLENSYLATPLRKIIWGRGVWLVGLLATGFVSAAVLKHFRPGATEAEWAVAFLPLVLASGGNSGSQSATLVIRALMMESLSRADCIRLLGRELMMATMLGGALMLEAFLLAMFLEHPSKAIVVAMTVFLLVWIGSMAGTLLPLAFKKLGMDPAMMSNPLIAALVDVTGGVIYYSVARAIVG